ncbi:accessory factor UbiK family protein [Ostreibacterium oceani]|uniref:Accessory factor UbiK family protein n=1 Tax=Ostreibacterium oceani TaxID=2654998 RepID=A0A6N7EYI5_9GAMM|nr:accessory factor UbiK family protein [Ostreibacterium oceani]MPV86615.1 accessory factor UbiK family protein [Ostreibacterium oceani]
MSQQQNKKLDDLLQSFAENAKQIKQEVDGVGRVILDSQLKKMDIVTREEFETLKAMVITLHQKLDRLETQIETQLGTNHTNQKMPETANAVDKHTTDSAGE